MALTIINLSDPVTTLVTKNNTVSRNLGDIEDLTTTVDSDVVGAINSLKSGLDTVNTTIADFKDSIEIVVISRSSIEINDAGGFGSLTYVPETGVITYNGPSQSDIRGLMGLETEADSYMEYDVANGNYSIKPNALKNHKIAPSTLTSSRFASLVTTYILDSDGSILKTLYTPGV